MAERQGPYGPYGTYGAPAGRWALPQPPPLPPALPPRPVYREPHRVTTRSVWAGLGAGALWLALFGALAHNLLAYAWWTVLAAVSAWAVAVLLAVFGDRGVAVGVAITSGAGLSIAMGFVTHRWITTFDWPLW